MSNSRFSVLQATAVKDKRISDSQFRTLAAIGMYANQEGWCFPSLKTLGKALSKSFQAVSKDTIALQELGYLEVKNRYDKKTGGRHSNLYRLLFDLPALRVDEPPSTSEVEPPSTSEVEPPSTSEVEVNVLNNVPNNDPINKRSNRTDAQKLGDIFDGIVAMSQWSGAKKSERIDNLAEIIHIQFGITPKWEKWKNFLEFVDKRQQEQQQMLMTFLDWLKATPNFDVSFWGPDRMREHWDRAFISEKTVTVEADGGMYV